MRNDGRIKTLGQILTTREKMEDASRRSGWDTPAMGVSLSRETVYYHQAIRQIPQTSGFVWGRNVWGVDEIDADTSSRASTYGLS